MRKSYKVPIQFTINSQFRFYVSTVLLALTLGFLFIIHANISISTDSFEKIPQPHKLIDINLDNPVISEGEIKTSQNNSHFKIDEVRPGFLRSQAVKEEQSPIIPNVLEKIVLSPTSNSFDKLSWCNHKKQQYNVIPEQSWGTMNSNIDRDKWKLYECNTIIKTGKEISCSMISGKEFIDNWKENKQS